LLEEKATNDFEIKIQYERGEYMTRSPMRAGSITLKDVARLAGVSVSTVSRALLDKSDISEETKAKVNRIAEDIGYLPNTLARDLRTRRTHTIGLVISDNSNPFYARLVRGVQNAAIKRGFHMVFVNSDENYEMETKAVKFLKQLRVAGLILSPAANTIDHVHEYSNINLPLVVVTRRLEGIDVNTVKVDDIKGAYLGTSHLIELGYHDIVFINGPMHISNARDRLKGYSEALMRNHLPFKEQLIFSGNINSYDGYQTAKKVLESVEPQAIFCYSDFVAIGVMKALAECGHKVPDDVSIVGFDDIELLQFMPTSLTTIRHPMYEIGEKATNLLIDIISKRKKEGPYNYILEPELIVRQSTRSN